MMWTDGGVCRVLEISLESFCNIISYHGTIGILKDSWGGSAWSKMNNAMLSLAFVGRRTAIQQTLTRSSVGNYSTLSGRTANRTMHRRVFGIMQQTDGAGCAIGSKGSGILDHVQMSHNNILSSTTSRQFASRRRKQQSSVLANERLIKAIMNGHGASSPDDVEVRLVIDEGWDKKATVEVVSLADAMRVSIDKMTDLIGTEINQKPPVIRATRLSKLEFQKEKMATKNKQSGKKKKSFRFKATIDDHDLDRKVAEMTKFLMNGQDCDFSVFSNGRTMARDKDAGIDLVERIKEKLSDLAQLRREPEFNSNRTLIQVSLEPLK